MTCHNFKIASRRVAFALVPFLMVPGVSDAEDFLSQSDLHQALVGNTFIYTGDTNGITRVSEDGTFTIVGDSKYGDLSGRWWFKGSQWCRVFDPVGYQTCSQYLDLGDGKIQSTSGYVLEIDFDTAADQGNSQQS